MKANDNLFQVFYAAEVDEAELAQILQGHFHGAMQPSINEIVYPGHETEYALKLIYDKNGLIKIDAGPTLTDEDVASIKSNVEKELLTSTGMRVGTEIWFANVPVEGCFQYQDSFQILPVPLDAPRPPFPMGDHPFLLQFQFPESSNWNIRHLRRAVRGRQLELVMSGILQGSIHGLGKRTRHHWVLLPHEPEEEWKVAYCQEMYDAAGVLLEADDFSPLEAIPKLTQVDSQKYYTRLGISAGQQFDIPSSLVDLLDRFSALSEADGDRFLRACFWFQHARVVHKYSRSAAFMALICAVEALVPKEEPTSDCESCGRPLGRGWTQRFTEFVDRFAPQEESYQLNRRKFYSIRSALSHGGTLLHSDRTAWSTTLTPEQTKEWFDTDAAWRLVRVVLVNWLSLQS